MKCKVCSRPFSDPSNLNKHVRLHSQGDTPYRCLYCDKILVRKRDLDRHILSRHHHVLPSSSLSSEIHITDEPNEQRHQKSTLQSAQEKREKASSSATACENGDEICDDFEVEVEEETTRSGGCISETDFNQDQDIDILSNSDEDINNFFDRDLITPKSSKNNQQQTDGLKKYFDS